MGEALVCVVVGGTVLLLGYVVGMLHCAWAVGKAREEEAGGDG